MALLKRAENSLLLPLLDEVGRSRDNWHALDAAAAAADAAVARARDALKSDNGGAATAAAERDMRAIAELLDVRCRALRQAGGVTAHAGEELAALGSQLAAAVDTRRGLSDATLRLCESTLAPALDRSDVFRLRAVAAHTRAIIAEARVKALQCGSRGATNGQKRGAANPAVDPLDAIFGASTARAGGTFVSGAANSQAADDALLQGLLTDMRSATPTESRGSRGSNAAANAAAAAAGDAMLQGLMQKMHVDPSDTRGRRSRGAAAPAPLQVSTNAAAGAGASAIYGQANATAGGGSAAMADPLDSLLQPMQAAASPSPQPPAPAQRELSHWQPSGLPPVGVPAASSAELPAGLRGLQMRPQAAPQHAPMPAAAGPPPPPPPPPQQMPVDPIASLLQPMTADRALGGAPPPQLAGHFPTSAMHAPGVAHMAVPPAPSAYMVSQVMAHPLLAVTPPPPPPPPPPRAAPAPAVDRQQPFVSLAPPPSPGPRPKIELSAPSAPQSAAAPLVSASAPMVQSGNKQADAAAVLQGLLAQHAPGNSAAPAHESTGRALAALLGSQASSSKPPQDKPPQAEQYEEPPTAGDASSAPAARPPAAGGAAVVESAPAEQANEGGGQDVAPPSGADKVADPALALWDMLAKGSRS